MKTFEENLLQRFLDFAREKNLWQAHEKIILACSGGADSLALCELFSMIEKKFSLKIAIAHFHHGLRGKNADGDADFVKNYAKKKGWQFFFAKENINQLAQQKKLSIETAARLARYEFLKDCAEKFHAEKIATAHHADDLAETVLFRILRGTGLDGLTGIPEKRLLEKKIFLIRPLLFAQKNELEIFCQLRKISPRHDETNDEFDATRNQIRLDLLPKIQREYNENIAQALCRLSEIAKENAAFIQACVQKIFPEIVQKIDDAIEIDCEKFLAQEILIQREILREVIKEFHREKSFGFVHYELLRKFFGETQTGKQLQLPKKIVAKTRYQNKIALEILKEPSEFFEKEIEINGKTLVKNFFIETKLITPEEFQKNFSKNHDANEFYLNFDAAKKIFVRSRKNGDAFFFDKTHQQSLKKFFIDQKIDRDKRNDVLIFTANDEIFWIAFLRKVHRFSANAHTKKILQITIKKAP